jgi:TrmH family RNA methyltransferase
MASIGRVQVHYEELAPLLNKQTENCIYAAVLNGISVQKLEKVQAGILLIGNESKGISQELLALANKKITIPKIGKAESLNAAVATGIILSHLR